MNSTSVENPDGFITKNVTSADRKMLARGLSEESIVLLSNKDKTLPMDFK